MQKPKIKRYKVIVDIPDDPTKTEQEQFGEALRIGGSRVLTHPDFRPEHGETKTQEGFVSWEREDDR